MFCRLRSKSYFIPDAYYDVYKDRFPTNVHPLGFLSIMTKRRSRQSFESIGWKAPTNTDTNSTNCLLNAFANQVHLERLKFHPYVWEIANMVRQGVMSRAEGIEKIYSPQNSEMVDYAKQKLSL